MKNQIKIDIPKGMEIDKKNSTFECIKFKEIGCELPTTWKELNKVKGYYIDTYSEIDDGHSNACSDDKNIFPTKELAEASLVLTQLLQLRERYNDGWIADWSKKPNYKYCICNYNDEIDTTATNLTHYVMHFKSMEIRNLFLKNFKDLLEIAKPLL